MRALGIHAGRWRAIQRALRHIRSSMHGLQRARPGAMLVAFALSLTHVALRLAVLPALVYGAGAHAARAAHHLAAAAAVWRRHCAGAREAAEPSSSAFALGLRKVLDPSMFAAALIWWRVYSFYLYLLAGAIVAGTTVLRAINNSSKPPAPVL